MEKRRLIEIAAGIVFVALLVLSCVWVVSASGNKITNYNTYNYYNQQQPTVRPYFVDKGDYARVYYGDMHMDYGYRDFYERDFRYAESHDKYLDYSDAGIHKVVTGVFGQDIQTYEVKVGNQEYVSGNFKVTFYFKDRYGQTDSKAMTYTIPAREEHKFTFKDITNDYRYSDWHYKVESMTKTPTRVYYN